MSRERWEGGVEELLGQREIKIQTRQKTGISLQVPASRKIKRSKVKNKKRLANKMRLSCFS